MSNETLGTNRPNNEFCKQHARIDKGIERSEEMFKEISNELKKKASNSTLMWGVGILVTLMIAFGGFLWGNVSFEKSRIESNQYLIIKKLDDLERRIESLGNDFEDHSPYRRPKK